MEHPNETPETLETERQRLIAEIATIGYALPGSLTARQTRCSSPGCHCKANPPLLHGPYYSWTRKIAGKTVTRALTTEQADRYTPWFNDARRLRTLIAALETISLQLTEHANKWGTK